MDEWIPDFLGPGFEQRAMTGDPGGTLVRFLPKTTADAAPALVYVHGWSDYYFNGELARFTVRRGWRFYALDLPEHGRSIKPGGLPGYLPSIENYLASIDAALTVVREEGAGPVVLMGHSTGGLAVALEAQQRPERLSAVVLSSPWLAPHGGRTAGRALERMLDVAARRRPERILPLPARGYFWRAIAREAGGEWDLRADYRPRTAFPIRAGWLRSILAAQRQLASGPRIAVPALLLAAAKSDTGLVWREHMRSRDAVLSIRPMRRAAAAACSSLDEVLVPGGLHDVLLSAPAVRHEAYERLGAWLDAALSIAPPYRRSRRA